MHLPDKLTLEEWKKGGYPTIKVFCDGKEVRYCIGYDKKKGRALYYVTDAADQPVLNKEKTAPLTAAVLGKITVEIEKK